MNGERYIATNPAGRPIVRTNSNAEAERCAAIMGGRVIDRQAVTA